MIDLLKKGKKKTKDVVKLILSKERTVLLTGVPDTVMFKSNDIRIPIQVNVINNLGLNVSANIKLIIEKGDAIFDGDMSKCVFLSIDKTYDKDMSIALLIQGTGEIKIKAEEVI